MKDLMFHELQTARIEAKILARKNKGEVFIVKTYDSKFILTDKMPMLGEWYHVYPDGLTIQRG